MNENVTATELLDTIRRTVNEWHAVYRRDTGRSVEPPVYLSSLANDIAHELGIMEAVDRERASEQEPHAASVVRPQATGSPSASFDARRR